MSFLSTDSVSLKICGITKREDAERLCELGVDALGVNYWPHSKRYIDPDAASGFLQAVKGEIMRVGVFVNADVELPLRLFEKGDIDLVQFHGDETVEYCRQFVDAGVPFIKAIGVKNAESLEQIHEFGATALLLDAHAPGVYGGTGAVFDWDLAVALILANPSQPVLLAGGITVENAAAAAEQVSPAVLDVASGAESAPGVKDFDKVQRLVEAIQEKRA